MFQRGLLSLKSIYREILGVLNLLLRDGYQDDIHTCSFFIGNLFVGAR
jgi:hypothetical protein